MKNIVLLCCAGMSTSMLMRKMEAAAAAKGVEYHITADTLNKEEQYVPTADVVLIGPQIRYATANLRKKYPQKTIVDIPMQIYGLMDGKKVLELAMTNMKDM